MSYSYLIKKAERILKSYLNSIADNDTSTSAEKKKIFDEFIKNEARRRTYQRKQEQSYQERTKENKQSDTSRRKPEEHYYNVLGIKHSASVEEIKKAYKILMTQYHPDKVANLGIELQNLAKKKTQEINEAYNFIRKQRNF